MRCIVGGNAVEKSEMRWRHLWQCLFAANALRPQLHVRVYYLVDLVRTQASPEPAAQWSLTSPRENLIQIGTKVAQHARYPNFRMAEVAVPGEMSRKYCS